VKDQYLNVEGSGGCLLPFFEQGDETHYFHQILGQKVSLQHRSHNDCGANQPDGMSATIVILRDGRPWKIINSRVSENWKNGLPQE
jgi:hypothetical protein